MKQFHELTITEMKAEGWGILDITEYQLQQDQYFVERVIAERSKH